MSVEGERRRRLAPGRSSDPNGRFDDVESLPVVHCRHGASQSALKKEFPLIEAAAVSSHGRQRVSQRQQIDHCLGVRAVL